MKGSTKYGTRLASLIAFGSVGLWATLAPASAHAQGTVSAQSLGYPPGELSTRAQGTAGALGDLDFRSPINPAALVLRAAPQVFAQYDPELRSVTGPNGSSNTTTARFPNVGAVLPVNRHFVLGVGASTLLDRTWATQAQRTQVFPGGDSAASTESLRSEGGITDLHLAGGYALGGRLRIGLGLHGYTGSTRVTSRDVFADSLRYRSIIQTSNLSYSGSAISGGLILDIVPQLSVAVSGRKGGSATMYAGDTVLARAHIPDRYSGSLSFQGLPGTTIAVRASRELWTQIGGLSTLNSPAVDATDYSVGLESAGPRVGGLPLLIRAGARRRTLPFPVAGNTVNETSFGGGLGIPIAFNRVTLDLSALRSSRTGVPQISEHAYNFSFGLQVHP